MRFVGRLTLLVLVPVLGLVGLAIYFTVYFSNASERSYQRVIHTYDVIETAQALLSDVQDAETGQRGFIITADPGYLDLHNHARARIPERMSRLESLVSDSVEQSERLRRLRPLIEERLRALQLVIEPASRSEMNLVRELMQSGRGKRLMDEIRLEIGAFMLIERQLLDERRLDSRQSERLTLYVGLAGSLIALAALIVGTLLLLASNWRLQRAEAQLARQGGVLQGTLENIRHGIAFFDARNRLAAFNRRFFTTLDFPAELAKRHVLFEAFSKVEKQRGTELLRSVPDDATSLAAPTPVRFNGRELEIYRTVTNDGGFVISCVDVTQRMRAEAMFRQTQKMESIGQLTGGVAHDFNNLLQIISSNIDVVLASDAGDPRNKQRLETALAGAERGARLTRQLLAFARRQPLEPRPTNLGRLVGEITDLVRRSLGEAVEVETVIAGGLWNAMVDPGQLENAILNLAINGRDAMPEGGKLTIELANASLDEAYAAEVSDIRPGQYVMLAVSDTGVGMAPDVAARAFEPFYSTKPEGQGTGLGLSQVYGYAKQLGGHVKIYSEPGHGTTVKMYLPRTRQPEDTLVAAPMTPIEPGSETVLVVEDDAAVRAGAIDVLTDLGYRVLQAGNAEAALAIVASGAPIDILFTDVVMPGSVKARELVRQARARLPGIAALYTSGYTENAIIHDGRLDSDVLLISKPYRRDELARKLRTALDQARRSPSAAEAPATPFAAPPSSREAAESEVKPVQSGAVLFVEDDVLVRLSSIDFLQDAGMCVIEASTAEAALAEIRAHSEIDVMLSDLGLPGMSGADLIKAARNLRPDLRIAVLTGRSCQSLTEEGVLPPDVICVEKPYELNALRRVVDALRSVR